MWYLSRTPTNLTSQQQQDETTIHCTKTIFPPSDYGTLNDISIIKVADRSCINTAWEWFAHQSSSMEEFQAVVVPRNLPLNIQVLTVIPETGLFLCALVVPSDRPFAHLCFYSPQDNLWNTVSRMDADIRNPMVAAAAIVDNCLYLAGGYMGNPSHVEPIAYLNSAERLNLSTGKWETLAPMQKRRSSAVGVAHRGKYYVTGGNVEEPCSVEVYDPVSRTWEYNKFFVPTEPDGFAMGSLDHRLFMLTWSEKQGVKLFVRTGSLTAAKGVGWTMVGYLPDQEERHRLKKCGSRLVKVGRELWVVLGDSANAAFQVNGACSWPTFSGPSFRPAKGCKSVPKDRIFAFSCVQRLIWREIPVYSI